MPFGRHKGSPLSEVPEHYVKWLLQQAWIKPNLRKACEERARYYNVPMHWDDAEEYTEDMFYVDDLNGMF